MLIQAVNAIPLAVHLPAVHLPAVHLPAVHLPVQVSAASGGPADINTQGIVSFFASKIAPILLAVLGVIFIGRASKGEISRVLTSSAIALIGLAFIAGAVSLFFVGGYLINLTFK
jgi:type IV secretory pathway VirB2 component (pilin)